MIQKKGLTFHNVIFTDKKMAPSKWKRAAVELRKFAIDNGFYQTGPMFYTNGHFMEIDAPNTEEREYRIFLPVNSPVIVEPGQEIGFMEELHIASGLSYRQPDSDEPEKSTYALLLTAAEQNDIKLADKFYHIYLDVYGEGLLEVYAPIKEKALV